MSREINNPRRRTRDGFRIDDSRNDAGYEPTARTPPPGPDAELEPTRVEVERRSGTERRVVDQPVEVDRREMDRRAAREQEQIDARERRRYAVARVTQGVDYLFILLYGLLGIRFVLALLGASAQAGFVQFINGITNPFYAPFANIVSRPALNGGVLDFPLLIAVLAYALLHLAVRGLLRLVAGSRTVP
jgi:YggT family protein